MKQPQKNASFVTKPASKFSTGTIAYDFRFVSTIASNYRYLLRIRFENRIRNLDYRHGTGSCLLLFRTYLVPYIGICSGIIA
jgi:hypothetical protein